MVYFYTQERRIRVMIISSSFTVWTGEAHVRKGRFFENMMHQINHWLAGSVRMVTLPSFSLELDKSNLLILWYISRWYSHIYLHPKIRDIFILRYYVWYFRCIALPFGLGRSVLFFTKIMCPVVQHINRCYNNASCRIYTTNQ